MDEFKTKFVEESAKELVKPVAETVGNVTLPISKSIGKTFSEVWDLILGSHVTLAREKQIVRQSDSLDKYKIDIQTKIDAIPEERLIEAPLHVIGPAIEAAKYYVENEDLSEMFSNLIASAFDSEKILSVHPSFTEVIKQFSPLDAKNVNLFNSKDTLPLCEVQLVQPNNSGINSLVKNFFINNEEEGNITLNSSSISNLIRLGIVESPYGTSLTNKDLYNKFKEHPFYIGFKERIEFLTSSGIYPKGSVVKLDYGIVRLTPFGKDFLNSVVKK